MTRPDPRRGTAAARGEARSRGVSTTLSYVLTLGITTLLLTGLVTATAGYVEDQRERIVRTELGIIGQQVAATVENADHVGASGGEVELTRQLPRQIARTGYQVAVNESGSDEVVVSASVRDGEVRVVVPVNTEPDHTVVSTTVQGGPVRVTFTPNGGAGDEIEVQSGV